MPFPGKRSEKAPEGGGLPGHGLGPAHISELPGDVTGGRPFTS